MVYVRTLGKSLRSFREEKEAGCRVDDTNADCRRVFSSQQEIVVFSQHGVRIATEVTMEVQWREEGDRDGVDSEVQRQVGAGMRRRGS